MHYHSQKLSIYLYIVVTFV